MLHPHYYTLSVLKHVLGKTDHTLFPQERLEEMKKEHAKLEADSTVTQAQIEDMIIRFGKEIWPYQEGLEELYRRHGKAVEEARVREKLTPHLKAKYEQFLASGGSLSDFRRGAATETYFTPEEKFEIGGAVLDAHATTLHEIASSCRADKQHECEEVIKDHKQKLAHIEEKLIVLRELATRSDKWRPEIEDKIRTFEESFGYLERTFHESDIDGAIDYYDGIMGLLPNALL
ncbi:MAG: hypothetical protein Q7S48_05285 [bacterium]|nr:hypothetical protein [bacterium]